MLFHKEIAEGEAMTRVFKDVDRHFSPAEVKEHSNETLAAMKKEIELQEQNKPHEPAKLRFFPKKREK